jgi:hypothetical protein
MQWDHTFAAALYWVRAWPSSSIAKQKSSNGASKAASTQGKRKLRQNNFDILDIRVGIGRGVHTIRAGLDAKNFAK